MALPVYALLNVHVYYSRRKNFSSFLLAAEWHFFFFLNSLLMQAANLLGKWRLYDAMCERAENFSFEHINAAKSGKEIGKEIYNYVCS